jgi:hypothetical protein
VRQDVLPFDSMTSGIASRGVWSLASIGAPQIANALGLRLRPPRRVLHMWLVDFILRRPRPNDFIGRIAAKVAHDSHRSVWSRVSHRVLTMRLNEARGYVRARACQCIHSEVEQVMRRNPQLRDDIRQELISRATDHVVGLVIRDVLVMPAETHTRRRAA